MANINMPAFLKVLSNFATHGHEVVSCNFETGEVVLKVSIDPAQMARTAMEEGLLEILRKGQKIGAIKFYRDTMGVMTGRAPGLADAKDFVEAFMISSGLGFKDQNGSINFKFAPVP